MFLNETLRQEIRKQLIDLSDMDGANGRKALLLNAGLSGVLSSLELSGSADQFVTLLIDRLARHGLAEDGIPALVLLLQAAAERVGFDRKAVLSGLREQVNAQAERSRRAAETCPYRGLEAFQERDAARYFGRETVAAHLADLAQAQPFVAVVGASGSGKSSLVFAGLLPRLRHNGSLVVLAFHPGLSPLEKPQKSPMASFATVAMPLLEPEKSEVDRRIEINKMAANFTSGDLRFYLERIRAKHGNARLLCVIDQFEELYTLCDDLDERRRFLDELLTLAGSSRAPQIALVITLRSDFLGQTHSHPALSHLIAAHHIIVPAMDRDELRRAIAQPAANAGQPFSDEVVELLIEQSAGRAGALPLLEFALASIWDGLAHGVEPAETLAQIGGVGGALANKARDIFAALSADEQRIARRAFLAMTRLGEGTHDTRRRAAIAEMTGHQDAPDAVRRVLGVFAQPGARLLTLDADAAEITHEALFEHWDELRTWIDTGRDDVRFHRQLAETVTEWHAAGRPEGSLWRPPKLETLRQFHQRRHADMTAQQVAFWQESERKEKQTRLRNRLTWAGLVLLTVVSLLGAWWAIRSEHIAQQEQKKTKIKMAEALNQTTKVLLLSKNDELSALLGIVKAGKLLKETNGNGSIILRNQVTCNLRESVYSLHEKNRLEGLLYSVNGVNFNLDGTILVSGSSDGTIKLWNVKTGKILITLKGHTKGIACVKFSPDNSILASGSLDGTIKLWNIKDYRETNTIHVNSNGVNDLDFSFDSKTLVSGGRDGSLKLWDVRTGKEIKTLQEASLGKYFPESIFSVNFNPNGSKLIVGTNFSFKLWNVENGKNLYEKPGSDIRVTATFSPNGEIFAIGSGEGGIHFLRSENGEDIQKIEASESSWGVNCIDFSPDGQIVASGNWNGIIELWNVENGQKIKSFQGHRGNINSIDFSPDGKILASGGEDNSIRFWDIVGNDNVFIHSYPFNKVKFNKDGMILGSNRSVWLLSNNNQFNSKKLFDLETNTIDFDQEGKLLFSGNVDGTITVWSIKDGQIIYSSSNNTKTEIEDISLHPNNKWIAIGTGRLGIAMKLQKQNIKNDNIILSEHPNRVSQVKFSPDGKIFASSSIDGVIKLWDIENGIEIKTLKGDSNLGSFDFSIDSKMIVAGFWNGSIKIWRTFDNKTVEEFPIVPRANITDIKFNHDGTILAISTGSWQQFYNENDNLIVLLDTTNWNEIARLYGHRSAILSIDFSPDGKLLVSGSDDATIRFWNLDMDNLLVRGCEWLYDYLKNPYANISDEDRAVCDDILHGAE